MTRTVRANLNLTLDGRFNGPGGPGDLSAIVPYAVTGVARDHLTRLYEGATTVVIGRGNAMGFMSYWPPVADDENADPRDRGYAAWLRDTEKVIFSTTLTDAPWPRTRVVNGPPADIVTELRDTPGGDILVNSSPTILKALLAADQIDRLQIMINPEIVGTGERLFDDGLPATKWSLTHHQAGDLGELSLTYDRAR